MDNANIASLSLCFNKAHAHVWPDFLGKCVSYLNLTMENTISLFLMFMQETASVLFPNFVTNVFYVISN